jgi:hypothetical protein
MDAAAMRHRRLRSELSVIALICTLGIFLFPATSGPYSSIHGPVTALRAIRISGDVVQSFQSAPSKNGCRRRQVPSERTPKFQTQTTTSFDLPRDLILRC